MIVLTGNQNKKTIMNIIKRIATIISSTTIIKK